LKLFSTVLRGRAVDLFLNSGMTAGTSLSCSSLNRMTLQAQIFFNLGGSVALVSHLCMSRVAERWRSITQRVVDGLPDTGFG